MEIIRGQIWKYSPRRDSEYIIEELGEMKIGDGRWIESVTYRCTHSAKVYTRDLTTFLTKFELRKLPKELEKSRDKS